ncbi:MAG: alpha/beta fold hydrolase [Lachnospiraceae bacterium]|nr:alpha/beta fold hydrolase [Lachnospiraceae bacterium]
MKSFSSARRFAQIGSRPALSPVPAHPRPLYPRPRLLILALWCLLLCFLLIACGRSADDPSQAARTESVGEAEGQTAADRQGTGDVSADLQLAAWEEQARQLVASMRAGDFDTVAALFNEQMAAALTAETLKEGWDATIEPLGAYVGPISATAQALENGGSVAVLEKYEGNGILVQVSFDGDGRLQGLWITYQDVSGMEVAVPESDARPETAAGTEALTPSAASETVGDSAAPALPAHVTEEEILVCGHPDYPLAGTLTLPEGGEPPAVVIFVHGSGSSDRNESINGNAPFRDIAWGLAERGIASIRYDKRYYTYPQAAADQDALTIEAEVMQDVDAAIALAMNDPRLDSRRVYVLGHSLGGMLAPAIADAHPDLAGIVSMAGSLRPLWDIVYDQNQEAAQAVRPSLSEEESRQLDKQLALVEADRDTLRQLSENGQLADLSLLPQDISPDAVFFGIPLSYWSSLERFCGARLLEHISMPILILQGDADFQVYPDTDYTLWQSALAGRENVVFHLYAGLNHLMMPTQGRRDLSEYAVKNTVSEEVIADIADFILRPLKAAEESE